MNFTEGNDKKQVIVRDYQKHPLTHKFTHIDFQCVDMSQPINVIVDIDFVGTPIGKKQGAILMTPMRTVKIQCLPTKIPATIELDITDLDAGYSLHVSDLPEGDYEILTPGKVTLCGMSIVKDDATTAEAGEEGAEGESAEGAAPAEGAAAPAAEG